MTTWTWAMAGRLEVDRDGDLTVYDRGDEGEDGTLTVLGPIGRVDRDELPARDRADFDNLLDRWRDASRPGF